VFKDIVNAIILLSLFIYFYTIINKNDLKYFYTQFIKILFFFSILISVVNLLFLFDILVHKDFLFNNSLTNINLDESSKIDYNFAVLPLLFGFFCIAHTYIHKKTVNVVLYIPALLLFTLPVLLSGSKRGFILWILIVIISVLLSFISFILKNELLKKIRILVFYYCFTLISVVLFSYIIIIKTPYDFKNSVLKAIGSKNILITKNSIALRLFRYAVLINKKSDFNNLYNFLWTPVFNPSDPDSSWGTRIHKTVFPLTGNNVSIVPSDAKGYLMNYTCNPSYYPEISLCESYSLLTVIKANKGDSYEFDVYCYVSKEFDIDVASLTIQSSSIQSDILGGTYISYYDLNNKDQWQRLKIRFQCSDGSIPVYLSFIKRGVKDFSKLKGGIIFAYPTYRLVSNNLLSNKQTFHINSDNLFDKNINQNKHSLLTTNNKIIKSSLFDLNFSKLENDSLDAYKDPIRNFFTDFISEDTTYSGMKSKISIGNSQDNFTDDRILRWKFAAEIFKNEYDWKKKLFGSGFNHLNWYGYYFMGNKTVSDWPHNPFLSVLLYSGIAGLLIYCIFLFKVFYYYIKYIKEYPLLFIFFLITFFFSFFSAGSPFDPPVMGFFSILPILIHSIHRKA
jgi:hypothetical protein